MPPDGERVSSLKGDHRELLLSRWKNGKPATSLLAPPGLKFDNQCWSNEPDWIVSQSEGTADVYAHHLPSGKVYRLTQVGDVNRPDLRVKVSRK